LYTKVDNAIILLYVALIEHASFTDIAPFLKARKINAFVGMKESDKQPQTLIFLSAL